MVPLIINPIYTLYSCYFLGYGISPFEGLLAGVKQLGFIPRVTSFPMKSDKKIALLHSILCCGVEPRFGLAAANILDAVSLSGWLFCLSFVCHSKKGTMPNSNFLGTCSTKKICEANHNTTGKSPRETSRNAVKSNAKPQPPSVS